LTARKCSSLKRPNCQTTWTIFSDGDRRGEGLEWEVTGRDVTGRKEGTGRPDYDIDKVSPRIDDADGIHGMVSNGCISYLVIVNGYD